MTQEMVPLQRERCCSKAEKKCQMRDRHTETDTQRQTHTERDTQRQTHTETDTQRQTHTERRRCCCTVER